MKYVRIKHYRGVLSRYALQVLCLVGLLGMLDLGAAEKGKSKLLPKGQGVHGGAPAKPQSDPRGGALSEWGLNQKQLELLKQQGKRQSFTD